LSDDDKKKLEDALIIMIKGGVTIESREVEGKEIFSIKPDILPLIKFKNVPNQLPKPSDKAYLIMRNNYEPMKHLVQEVESGSEKQREVKVGLMFFSVYRFAFA
jgi:hypothetical protein